MPKLLDDFGNGAGADGVAAFANGEAQALFERYRCDQRNFAAHVVAGHHHLDACGQLHVARNVRGAEIKLWTVAGEKRSVTPAFFLGQHVGFSLELGVRRNRTGLANYLAAPLVLDLVLFLDLAQRSGMKGIQEWLSFYFKAPMTAPGLYPEHDVFIQLMKLKNTLRWMRGEDLITHLGLEYYD